VPRNKTPWIVGGVLILLLVVGVVCATRQKEESAAKIPPPPESARAVVVPVNRARTVVIPPCNTPVSDTTSEAVKGAPVPGATTFQLPREGGVRNLLVPHCQPGKSSTNLAGDIPSAAFVLPEKERLTKDGEGRINYKGVIADSQLTLPNGSRASTIVIPGCTTKEASRGRDIVIGAPKDQRDVAVAPSC